MKSYPVTRAYDVRLFEAKRYLAFRGRGVGACLCGEKGTESDVETMVKVETAKVGGNAFAVKEKNLRLSWDGRAGWMVTCYVSRVRVWKWTWR